ncbi:MAG: hypothetical protein KAH32_02625, partial [Chlamydiia bacterium]|nr:hypothetical protein [Chlamydiia bacterium]
MIFNTRFLYIFYIGYLTVFQSLVLCHPIPFLGEKADVISVIETNRKRLSPGQVAFVYTKDGSNVTIKSTTTPIRINIEGKSSGVLFGTNGDMGYCEGGLIASGNIRGAFPDPEIDANFFIKTNPGDEMLFCRHGVNWQPLYIDRGQLIVGRDYTVAKAKAATLNVSNRGVSGVFFFDSVFKILYGISSAGELLPLAGGELQIGNDSKSELPQYDDVRFVKGFRAAGESGVTLFACIRNKKALYWFSNRDSRWIRFVTAREPGMWRVSPWWSQQYNAPKLMGMISEIHGYESSAVFFLISRKEFRFRIGPSRYRIMHKPEVSTILRENLPNSQKIVGSSRSLRNPVGFIVLKKRGVRGFKTPTNFACLEEQDDGTYKLYIERGRDPNIEISRPLTATNSRWLGVFESSKSSIKDVIDGNINSPIHNKDSFIFDVSKSRFYRIRYDGTKGYSATEMTHPNSRMMPYPDSIVGNISQQNRQRARIVSIFDNQRGSQILFKDTKYDGSNLGTVKMLKHDALASILDMSKLASSVGSEGLQISTYSSPDHGHLTAVAYKATLPGGLVKTGYISRPYYAYLGSVSQNASINKKKMEEKFKLDLDLGSSSISDDDHFRGYYTRPASSKVTGHVSFFVGDKEFDVSGTKWKSGEMNPENSIAEEKLKGAVLGDVFFDSYYGELYVYTGIEKWKQISFKEGLGLPGCVGLYEDAAGEFTGRGIGCSKDGATGDIQIFARGSNGKSAMNMRIISDKVENKPSNVSVVTILPPQGKEKDVCFKLDEDTHTAEIHYHDASKWIKVVDKDNTLAFFDSIDVTKPISFASGSLLSVDKPKILAKTHLTELKGTELYLVYNENKAPYHLPNLVIYNVKVGEECFSHNGELIFDTDTGILYIARSDSKSKKIQLYRITSQAKLPVNKFINHAIGRREFAFNDCLSYNPITKTMLDNSTNSSLHFGGLGSISDQNLKLYWWDSASIRASNIGNIEEEINNRIPKEKTSTDLYPLSMDSEPHSNYFASLDHNKYCYTEELLLHASKDLKKFVSVLPRERTLFYDSKKYKRIYSLIFNDVDGSLKYSIVPDNVVSIGKADNDKYNPYNLKVFINKHPTARDLGSIQEEEVFVVVDTSEHFKSAKMYCREDPYHSLGDISNYEALNAYMDFDQTKILGLSDAHPELTNLTRFNNRLYYRRNETSRWIPIRTRMTMPADKIMTSISDGSLVTVSQFGENSLLIRVKGEWIPLHDVNIEKHTASPTHSDPEAYSSTRDVLAFIGTDSSGHIQKMKADGSFRHFIGTSKNNKTVLTRGEGDPNLGDVPLNEQDLYIDTNTNIMYMHNLAEDGWIPVKLDNSKLIKIQDHSIAPASSKMMGYTHTGLYYANAQPDGKALWTEV